MTGNRLFPANFRINDVELRDSRILDFGLPLILRTHGQFILFHFKIELMKKNNTQMHQKEKGFSFLDRKGNNVFCIT